MVCSERIIVVDGDYYFINACSVGEFIYSIGVLDETSRSTFAGEANKEKAI